MQNSSLQKIIKNMPKNIKTTKQIISESKLKVSKPLITESTSLTDFADKIRAEFDSNKSYMNLVIGIALVFLAGVLLFNYFQRDNATLGPAQQATEESSDTKQAADVNPENLPGQYSVKEGDTLYLIAEKYYNDGFQFPKLVEANKLNDANTLEVGQVLNVPKLETEQAKATPTSTTEQQASANETGTGGAENQTIWGERITGNTYVVVEGDWLSTIAGRAYGDIMVYEKIAQANNLPNPNLIVPGMELKLPR